MAQHNFSTEDDRNLHQTGESVWGRITPQEVLERAIRCYYDDVWGLGAPKRPDIIAMAFEPLLVRGRCGSPLQKVVGRLGRLRLWRSLQVF
jgi:hypothetical protein